MVESQSANKRAGAAVTAAGRRFGDKDDSFIWRRDGLDAQGEGRGDSPMDVFNSRQWL